MKSFRTNLVILALLSVTILAQQSTIQTKLSLIAAKMQHYALVTEASESELVQL